MKFVAKLWPGIAVATLLAVALLMVAIVGVGIGDSSAHAADPVCAGGKVKYYRNPMGASDTSPVPKKDAMNMDYIPVCEDEAGESAGTVKVSLDKVQRLGVRSEVVGERALARTVRPFASVQFDGRKQSLGAATVPGRIETL